ncbi:MAG: cupin domain-containing protein [Cyanobacteria bacterium J06638_7]
MDVKALLAELQAVPEGTFLNVLPFNGHAIGACRITGVSPVWEMHPDTDEFFYILEGTFELTLLTEEGSEFHSAAAGSALVVPRGLWHRPGAPQGAQFLYFTPGQSLHSEAADPRLATP